MTRKTVKIDFAVLDAVMGKICSLPYQEVNVLVSSVRESVLQNNPPEEAPAIPSSSAPEGPVTKPESAA